MLKRFLKFFKPEEQADLPEFEGSYLDFLMGQVMTGVVEELEECQEHDPLLLVIAGVLRQSMRGAWSPKLRRPLVEPQGAQKPTASPPPPPMPPRAPSPDEIIPAPGEESGDEELESVEETSIIEEAPEGSSAAAIGRASPDEAEDPDEGEGEDALEEDFEIVDSEQLVEEFVDGEQLAEETSEPEVLDEDSELIEEVATIDETQEFEGVDRVAVESEGGEDDLPRVDQKEVLQAGRVFLGLLIENDRLPIELQLGLEETSLARDLLVGYFVGRQDFEERAQQLLRIVERKFSEGQFSQARILLQLFQTDRQTRIRNDRNIFYEDMIQRLGIRRRHPVAADVLEEFEAMELEGADQLIELTRWLDEHLFIKFYLFTRHPEQVRAWRAIGSRSTREGAVDSLLKYLPPRRWRPFYQGPQGAEDSAQARALLREHVNNDTLATYISSQLRTCYFVLRAVGDTGLEGFLDTFFNWTHEELGVRVTSLLPELYRRSMGEAHMMKAIFEDLYQRQLREPAEAWLEELEEGRLEEALDGADRLYPRVQPQ